MPLPAGEIARITARGNKVAAYPAPGAAPVSVSKGDVVPALHGWHVVLQPHSLPVSGYPLGFSNELVHYSQGASYSGMGVPATPNVTQTWDQVATGYGTDGRAVSSDGTIGGAPGAAGVGSGGGSSQRGF